MQLHTATDQVAAAGGNGPEQTDYVAMKNLMAACPSSLQKFVYTSSAGVERSGQLPFSILNLAGAAQSLCCFATRKELSRLLVMQAC